MTTLLAGAVFLASAAVASADFKPIDPQAPEMPDDMTWDDYVQVPGTDWADPGLQPSVKKFRTALVFGDYPDQEPVISQPLGSTIFGNPQVVGGVPREDVPEFYADFLNRPQPLNNFVTMNKYWMEDSLGRYGVEVVPFGPYRLPGNTFEYNLRDAGGAGSACPTGFEPCSRSFRNDLRTLWRAAEGATIDQQFDNIFYVSAGHDESSTWQEFGEMRFQTMDDVTEEFGNPDPTKPNWAPTRYVPWTSFASAKTIWPSASGNSSTEAESSGMGTYAHELSHNFGIGDNYNNPYGIPLRRSYTGPWDMLSRGSFNGPGGPHTRWHVPAKNGGSLGANHNLRNKLELGFVNEENVLRLDRNGLDESGPVVARVIARAADPGPNGLTGVNVALNPSPDLADPTRGDQSPTCVVAENPDCPGPTRNSQGNIVTSSLFNNYTLEVVQRIGNDSFTPGNGVLISRTKNADSAPFVWIIDAHPEDFNKVDFLRPDGTPAMISYGDYRQLYDATFNAGLGSGTEYEYVDVPNRLHFYVIDNSQQRGIRSYQLAVRSLDGSGDHERGVKLQNGRTTRAHVGWTDCEFTLKNTGETAEIDPGLHPDVVDGFVQNDIYRLSATVEGDGWSGQLYNALATAKAGRDTSVRVNVEKSAAATGNAIVTLQATSESDNSKTDVATCTVRPNDVK